ncbi:hypothetical protein OCB14_26290 [Bacillus cereus]|nr:hypothetical protein [Bacillus cereus]
MNVHIVKRDIEQDITINRQRIIIAKQYIMSQEGVIDTVALLDTFTRSQGYPVPSQVVIHESISIEDQIKQASGYLSWYMAFSTAALELINSCCLIPIGQQTYPIDNSLRITYTTVTTNSGGGMTSAWSFNDYMIPIPIRIRKTLIPQEEQVFTLFDTDLFISNLDIGNAHNDVVEALHDTINCFKRELYRPSLTMLGKAVEGAWIELGISLIDYAISIQKDVDRNSQLKEKLMGPDSFAFKVEKVIDLYTSHYRDWFNQIRIETNIQPPSLRSIKVWTDIVRESRNAIHFGATVNSENNYEKTSMLLLASVSHFKTLYFLKQAANTHTSS